MTVKEWREKVPLLLDAFVDATVRLQQAGDPEFVGSEHEDRDETDWAREFAAYLQVVDLGG